jgi:hypothetical protein
MTTTVDGVTMTLFVNDPDIPFDTNWTFSMKSEMSQKDLLTGAAVGLVTQNARYMEFVVDVPADFKDKHTNGYYSWTMGSYTGFVKLITQPGGDMGTTDYVSDNENRESTVYYRPDY